MEHQLSRLGALAAVSAAVLWIAHVYSRGLGESITLGRRLTLKELLMIVRRERSIMLAAVPPVAFVELGAAGVFSNSTALALAFGIGVVTLAAQGVRYARVECLSRSATILTVGLNLLLGLTLVAVEALLAH